MRYRCQLEGGNEGNGARSIDQRQKMTDSASAVTDLVKMPAVLNRKADTSVRKMPRGLLIRIPVTLVFAFVFMFVIVSFTYDQVQVA